MLIDLIAPFIAVGLAELGDKTQLSIILLSTRTKKHVPLLSGVLLAFFIVDGMAILLGGWVTTLVPPIWIKGISSGLFILLGVLLIFSRGGKTEGKIYSKNPFLMGFVLVFISEWGDKTQIAGALFATKYNPSMVLLGVMLSLGILSVLAIFLGKLITKKIKPEIMTRVAGVLFIIIGMLVWVI